MDEDGNLWWDEREGDDVKLVGVYRTEEGAVQAKARAVTWPGFRDERDCFLLTPVAPGLMVLIAAQRIMASEWVGWRS